jgi:hypothetical protein
MSRSGVVPRSAMVALASVFLLVGPSARAATDGASSDGASPVSCQSDSDCASHPETPQCCVGAACAQANVCVACADYAGNPCAPLKCDGGLCDTTTGAACAVDAGRSGPQECWLSALAVAAAMVWLRLGRARLR